MVTSGESNHIALQIRRIRESMARAAERAGRDPGSIRLLVATKGVAVDRVEQAVRAGVSDIGENRLQEALPKIEALASRHPDLHWHFIGRLQRRKVRAIVGTFESIQSVESLALAEEIERRAAESGVRQRLLLEVNVGQEPSKGGFSPAELASAVLALEAMPHLRVEGLMTIPPYARQPESARPYFRQLRELAESVASPRLTRVRLTELSMGMSHDYEIAIEEGATMVRIGQAIFGTRDGAA